MIAFNIILVILAMVCLPAALLFAVRHSRLCHPCEFSQLAWRTLICWSALTIASSSFPLDYWLNPPFSNIAGLPRNAKVVSCYKISEDAETGFGNPFSELGSELTPSWFKRRGLARIMGKRIGETIPSLDAHAANFNSPKVFSVCIYQTAVTTNALMLERYGGIAGANSLVLRLFENDNDQWNAVVREVHRRSYFYDLIVRVLRATRFGLFFAAICLVFYLARRFRLRDRLAYLAPKRFAFSLVPAFILCFFGVVIASAGFMPYAIVDPLEGVTLAYLSVALGCFGAAYVVYRVTRWREMAFCSNRELKAISRAAPPGTNYSGNPVDREPRDGGGAR